MNNLNSSNPKDVITQVLQEILQEEPNYFFPKQLHVLSWKSKKIAGALITKVNGQRYLGLLRKDMSGQDYWKYKLLTGNSELETSAKENQVSDLKKSQVSLQNSLSAKQNSVIQSSSPTTTASSPPNSTQENQEQSEQVKKFREKYGTPSNPKEPSQ